MNINDTDPTIIAQMGFAVIPPNHYVQSMDICWVHLLPIIIA